MAWHDGVHWRNVCDRTKFHSAILHFLKFEIFTDDEVERINLRQLAKFHGD